MKKAFKSLTRVLAIVVSAVLFSACAVIEKHDAMDTERALAAAGFKMKFANSPEQIRNAEAMTQRQVVSHSKDGSVYYVYVDAKFCQCLYVGNEEVYQRYQRLALEHEIAQERFNAAEMNENAAMNWGVWGGGWGPYY